MGLDWAAGIAAAAGAAADIADGHIKNQQALDLKSQIMVMEELRDRRAQEYAARVLREHETWKPDQADQRRRHTAGEIEKEAGLLATGRANKPVQDQADRAALAYSDSDLPQADKDLAYRAAEEYARNNSSDTAPITGEDRLQAAIKLGHLGPKDVAGLANKETEQALRVAIAQGKIDSSLQIANAKGDIALQVAGIRADAQRDSAESRSESLTSVQRARNAEIELSRKAIEGLSQEEVKRRTQQYTNTGRENPEYDSQLARRVKRANQRKVGDDQWFDDLLEPGDSMKSPLEDSGTRSNDDILKEFMADKSMKAKGFKLGKRTPKGMEVLDASGKLIGHYQ